MSTDLLVGLTIITCVLFGLLTMGIVIPISMTIGNFISDKIESFFNSL